MMREMGVPLAVEWMAFYHLMESARESDSLQDDLEASVGSRMNEKQWQL